MRIPRAVSSLAEARSARTLLVAALAAGTALSAPEQAAPAPKADEALLAAAHVTGLTLAAIEDGAVARIQSIGVADGGRGTPITEATLFEAASLSKPVFATLVLRLAERGEFDLDQPLDELLPSERMAHDSRSHQLTARIVLSHRTGLPNWGAETLDFSFAPGERFGYSGEGYQYLQQVVEKVAGLSLDELARREIFEPLGMVHSRFSWPEGEAPVLALPHDLGGAPQEKRQVRDAMAAATLHTTAADYGEFVAAWLTGRLLRAETMAAALEPLARIVVADDVPPGERAAAERIAWGLGWGLQLPVVGGAGPIAMHWGDNGDFKAFVAFDPATRRGIVYFTNSGNGLAIGEALAEPVVGDLGATFDWLGYPRWDDPGEPDRLAALVAAGERRFKEAVAHYRAALAAGSEDESLALRIEWLLDLERLLDAPPIVREETLERWAGKYGPRVLSWRDGALWYQRQGRPGHRLIPLSATVFVLEGEDEFRLEIGLGEDGEPVKLIGHYIDGEIDESPRDRADQSMPDVGSP